MRINLNIDSLALLLFCGDMILEGSSPLTSKEWFELERKLKLFKKSPSDLLGMNDDSLLSLMGADEYVSYKIIARNKSMNALFKVIKVLENHGIHVTTIYENNYPSKLHNMKYRKPLYLYYVGDLSLCKKLVSISGPMSNAKDFAPTIKEIVNKIHDESYSLLVGGSEGIDKIALKENNSILSTGVLFVSHSMIDDMNRYSKYIRDGKILLMSAVDPFNYYDASNAIDASVYISALSDYQFVLATYINSGLAWFTAMQNIKYHYTELIVLNDQEYNGNMSLINMGCASVTYTDILSNISFSEIINMNKRDLEEKVEVDQMSIFDFLE